MDKKENFKKIAEKRTNEILIKIQSFVNFTNTSYYEYTEQQLQLIENAIKEELENTMAKLRKPEHKWFKLRDDK